MEILLRRLLIALYNEVRKAVGGEFRNFKPLDDLKSTLDSINPLIICQLEEVNKDLYPLIKQYIGEENKEISLPEDEAAKIKKQMEDAIDLVSKLGDVPPWNCITKCQYAKELAELDRSLKILEKNLNSQNYWFQRVTLLVSLRGIKVAEADKILLSTLKCILRTNLEANLMKETLIGLVNQSNEQQLENIELGGAQLSTTHPEQADQQQTSVVVDDNRGHDVIEETNDVMETSVPPVSNTATEIALRPAGHDVLFDVVVNDKMLEFKQPLTNIKSTLGSLRPLIQEMAYYKTFDLPMEDLKQFEEIMKTGAELIREIPVIGVWNFCKKHEHAQQLVELDQSLNKLSAMLRLQGLKDAKATLLVARNIEGLLRRIDTNSEAAKQYDPLPQLPQYDSLHRPPKLVVGLDEPLKQLKKKLLKDGASLLVLAAPGGCGKTTLATVFCEDQDVKDFFKENILFVGISRKPNLKLIAKKLCEKAGHQPPKVLTYIWVKNFLKEVAGQRPFLLVLDDVWPGSEFTIQMFAKFNMPNYKILVTSRFGFPQFGPPYYFRYSLNDVDAMKLFRHSATLGDEGSHIREVDLVRKIVESCKGFPLAITLAGKSLHEQPIEVWEEKSIQWSKNGIVHSEENLRLCLQSSLDALDEQMDIVKDCFLDLGAFLEDKRIPVTALIDMWAELYDIDEYTSCIANLNGLTTRNLATLLATREEMLGEDRYYGEHFVKQHALFRELAAYNTNLYPVEDRERLVIDMGGDYLHKLWGDHEHQPMKARLVSISADEMFSSMWQNMQLPEAEVLLLNFATNKYALPELVENLDKLKVLIVTNYDDKSQAELSNFELLGSLSNLKRIRLDRISIPSIIKNFLIQLKMLQKMSFSMCSIGQAFSSNSSIQVLEAFPNLVELNIDYCDDLVELPAKLCELIHLKVISITNCHKLSALPQEIGKLENMEVLRLRSCTKLSELPRSVTNLKMVNLLDISNCFSIKELPEEIGEMSGLRMINMKQCSRLQQLPESIVRILDQLEEVVCDDDTNYLWEPFSPANFTNLHMKVLKVEVNLNFLRGFQS